MLKKNKTKQINFKSETNWWRKAHWAEGGKLACPCPTQLSYHIELTGTQDDSGVNAHKQHF